MFELRDLGKIMQQEYAVLVEKRMKEILLSEYNAKNLIFESEKYGNINVHEMNEEQLSHAICLVNAELSTDLDKTLLRLLKLRLVAVRKKQLEDQKKEEKRLLTKYEEGDLKWMDYYAFMPIQDLPDAIIQRNLASLDTKRWEKYYAHDKGIWRTILNKEIKKRKQKKQIEDRLWPSSEGPIKVTEMNVSHIRNCLDRFAKGKPTKFNYEWTKIFNIELARRKKVEAEKKETERKEKEFRGKIWEAYKRKSLSVQVEIDSVYVNIHIQELTDKQIEKCLDSFSDKLICDILKAERESRRDLRAAQEKEFNEFYSTFMSHENAMIDVFKELFKHSF